MTRLLLFISSKPPSAKPKPSSSERETAGLAYDKADAFNALFHGYHDRYGLKTINEIKIEVSSDVFAGSDEGLFGQFHDNNFVKAGIKYMF